MARICNIGWEGWKWLVCGIALAIAFKASAAHQVPPELLQATDTVQQRYIEEQGKRSLRDKLEAGAKRIEQRQRFREQLIAGMKSDAARHKREMVRVTPAVPLAGAAPYPSSDLLVWFVILLLLGMLLWLRRQAPRNPGLSAPPRGCS